MAYVFLSFTQDAEADALALGQELERAHGFRVILVSAKSRSDEDFRAAIEEAIYVSAACFFVGSERELATDARLSYELGIAIAEHKPTYIFSTDGDASGVPSILDPGHIHRFRKGDLKALIATLSKPVAAPAKPSASDTLELAL